MLWWGFCWRTSRTHGSIAYSLARRNGAGSSASPQCQRSFFCLRCLVFRAVLDGWLCRASSMSHCPCFGLQGFRSQRESSRRLWLRFIRSELRLVILCSPVSTGSLSFCLSLLVCFASCRESTRFFIT